MRGVRVVTTSWLWHWRGAFVALQQGAHGPQLAGRASPILGP